jgi:hypothetical protein
MADQTLRGQRALVTGASSGIGLGVARALGAAGADVVVNNVSAPDAAERLAEEIRNDQCLTVKLEYLMKQQTKCGVHGQCPEGLFSRNLFLGQRIPLAGIAHQNGTARFGQ